MKRRFILFVVTGVLLLCLIAGFLIPVTNQATVSIKAPFQNIASTLLNLEGWKRWHPSFHSIDTGTVKYHADNKNPSLSWQKKNIQVIDQSPFGIRVTESGGNREIHYALSVVPQPDESAYVVSMRKKVSALESLYQSAFRKDKKDPVLIALKEFVETPDTYYGFPIEIGPVVDTIVLTRQHMVAESDLYPGISILFKELRTYIDNKQLNITGHPMLYSSNSGNDSVKIMTGIPVDRVNDNEGAFSYLTMPKGRMLIGHYEGQHRHINKLMEAMRQYIADHSLQPAALPYQKFLDNVIPTSSDAKVKCDVYFPIF